jgi:hypothetical protein
VRQIASNRSGKGHQDHFAGHRARLTREIIQRAPAGGHGRLCLLGAGNANDVDLDALAERYDEIHLVDVDAAAVDSAAARTAQAHPGRLMVHAPVDASGILDRLTAWARRPPGPDETAGQVQAAVTRVCAALPGPFDVVASCCLLTQLQLVLLEVVRDRNPYFDELRTILNGIHVRTLASLLAPGGVALLVTDLTGSDTYPLDDLAPDTDLGALMAELLAAGNVIHAAHPGRLSAEIRRDPYLRARYAVRSPIGPWLWHNGPDRTYLVYALEITAAGPAG